MMHGRTIVLVAAALTAGTLSINRVVQADAADRILIRRRMYDPSDCCMLEAPRSKVTPHRMTKREKREMMQHDFAHGGGRQGRRRRQRLHHARVKQ